MMELFEDQSLRQRMRRMVRGLKAPKDTGAYRYARNELQRLLAPIAAVLLPLLTLAGLVFLVPETRETTREIYTEIIDPEPVEPLEEIEDPLEPPPDIEPVEMDFTPEIALETPAPSPAQDAPVSPQPTEISAVQMVRSPIVMRRIFGSTRNTGQRGKMLEEFGGNRETEQAVLRALRWLRHTQASDGSWGRYKTAMTALAILTFLAHNELPESPEFGDTVRRAIEFLINAQQPDGLFRPRDGNNYSHPMATYALCEAYGMTLNPNVKEVALKALEPILEGQTPTGGWDYKMNPERDRNDSSYMGWCAQALKAAKMAELHVEGLEETIRKAIQGFRSNAHPEGGFGYTGPGRSGLTGVGVLCMQLLGAPDAPEVRKSMELLSEATYDFDHWDNQPYSGASPVYYWYYITQAKFHTGGSTWTEWNRMFNPELVKRQMVIPPEESGYKDHEGTPQEIGYWITPSENEHRGGDNTSHVQVTTMCALQLMVYYRYLPTFRPPEPLDMETGSEEESEDVEIEIIL